jgi:hypothetical protein
MKVILHLPRLVNLNSVNKNNAANCGHVTTYAMNYVTEDRNIPSYIIDHIYRYPCFSERERERELGSPPRSIAHAVLRPLSKAF